MKMCFIHMFFLVVLLAYTSEAFKNCETITININGVEQRRIGETRTNCSLFKDLANKCKSLPVEIVFDENVSIFHYTNYGDYINTIHMNITFYNESLTSSAIVNESTTGNNKVPIIISAVLGAAAVSGVLVYSATHIIKTIIQSGTYILPDPS